MCGDFNLEPSKDIKAIFKLNITPDKLSGLTDDVGIVTQEQLTEILNTSLAQKVDKVEGKSLVEDTEIQRLSTLENYNDSQIKQDISTIKSNLNTKVDKVDGKQLSTNDFTDDLKNKLTNADPEARVHSVNGQVGKVTIPIPDISPLATKQELEDGLATKQAKGDYASKSEVNSKAEKSYVDTELNKKADKTEIPDISNLATKDEIPAPYTLPTASTTTLGGVKIDGTTITINNGVISFSGGYPDLTNKPQINGVELSGNKTLDSLGIQAKGDYALKSSIPTKTSQLTNDSGFLTEHQDISSLATKSELDNKVDKVSGKQLSTNDFTTALKNKLDSVDVNAKVYSVNGKTGAVTIDVPDISILTPKVVEDLTSTAITIAKAEANTTYKYGTLTSLTITEVENSPLPITIIFTTATSSPTINLPTTLESINLADGFEAEKKYVLAIENNIAVIGSIE